VTGTVVGGATTVVVGGAAGVLDAAELAVWATNNAVVTPEPTKIACVRRRMFDSRRRRW
jgi:hypothetical protein